MSKDYINNILNSKFRNYATNKSKESAESIQDREDYFERMQGEETQDVNQNIQFFLEDFVLKAKEGNSIELEKLNPQYYAAKDTIASFQLTHAMDEEKSYVFKYLFSGIDGIRKNSKIMSEVKKQLRQEKEKSLKEEYKDEHLRLSEESQQKKVEMALEKFDQKKVFDDSDIIGAMKQLDMEKLDKVEVEKVYDAIGTKIKHDGYQKRIEEMDDHINEINKYESLKAKEKVYNQAYDAQLLMQNIDTIVWFVKSLSGIDLGEVSKKVDDTVANQTNVENASSYISNLGMYVTAGVMSYASSSFYPLYNAFISTGSAAAANEVASKYAVEDSQNQETLKTVGDLILTIAPALIWSSSVPFVAINLGVKSFNYLLNNYADEESYLHYAAKFIDLGLAGKSLSYSMQHGTNLEKIMTVLNTIRGTSEYISNLSNPWLTKEFQASETQFSNESYTLNPTTYIYDEWQIINSSCNPEIKEFGNCHFYYDYNSVL